MGEAHRWGEIICTHYLIINSKWFLRSLHRHGYKKSQLKKKKKKVTVKRNTRPSACVYTPSKHRPPHTHLASPVNRALRGIAETHVFIPSHFVQILQDLEEKRKHGRHPMREDP